MDELKPLNLRCRESEQLAINPINQKHSDTDLFQRHVFIILPDIKNQFNKGF
jgi:hypothetical protein